MSSPRKIQKVLIANRGEIACRVIRTVHHMGLKSVAVFSDADRDSPHVKMAGEAFFIGPAPARESYLKMDTLIDVARASGADAIHPGYGFLSENPEFAQACETAGIKFIGPSSASISAMGSKSAAKLIMEKASVPLIPGYHGENQEDDRLMAEAERIGFPLLIKAAFGGGGKGMRVVESADAFLEALQSCRREAQASFGNATVLLEKYLTQPRHVEIQVFCDSHGNGVYLHERDCSIQRRHQKIIEEAPAPGLSAATRRAMGEAAVAAARAIAYEGAGTIEFLLDTDGKFYFMEMNTRLQVEHPVTEYITGLDLVDWQIRVARGEVLPLSQGEVPLRGHAIEARICAESPDKEFRPSIGRLHHFQPPPITPHVRVDTGIAQGSEVTIYYDPMVAKLIVWGETREQATARLAQALEGFQVLGVDTNIHYLYRIISLDAFKKADLSTHFLQQEQDALQKGVLGAGFEQFAWAGAVCTLSARGMAEATPWDNSQGWQVNASSQRHFELKCEDEVQNLSVREEQGCFVVAGKSETVRFQAMLQGDTLRVAGDKTATLPCLVNEEGVTFFVQGKPVVFAHHKADYSRLEQADSGHLQAAMPGRIVQVLVAPGDHVEAGQALLVMEAMKMEQTLRAPFKGRVEAVHFKVGDAVREGVELVSLQDDHLEEPAEKL